MAQRKASVGGSSASEEGSPEGLPGVGVRAGAEWGTPTCWGSLVGYGGSRQGEEDDSIIYTHIHTYTDKCRNRDESMGVYVYVTHIYILILSIERACLGIVIP